MNNSQFRHLLVPGKEQARVSDNHVVNGKPSSRTGFGSRHRASAPMTPRAVVSSIASSLFAKQLAERGEPQRKKVKQNVPKGAKLPSQYRDRTKDRAGSDAPEEGVEEQSEEGRGSTNTVLPEDGRKKGLDLELLARSREGADTMELIRNELGDADEVTMKSGTKDPQAPQDDEQIEGALEEIENQTFVRKAQQRPEKKGTLASTPAVNVAAKRSRNEILAEFRRAREAAKPMEQPSVGLGMKFRTIGSGSGQPSRIERDEQGREVLITVDEMGVVKRKVRKPQRQEISSAAEVMQAPLIGEEELSEHAKAQISAMRKAEEDQRQAAEAEDIFADAGDYDPLAGLEDEDSSEGETKTEQVVKPSAVNPEPSKALSDTVRAGNYFNDTLKPSNGDIASKFGLRALADPHIPHNLKDGTPKRPRARTSPSPSASDSDAEDTEAHERRRDLLRRLQGEGPDRDAADMDLGFGSSFIGDAEDGEETGKVKLSKWTGKGDGEGDDEGGERKDGTRKRGKRKKNRANNAADVLRVIAERRGGT